MTDTTMISLWRILLQRKGTVAAAVVARIANQGLGVFIPVYATWLVARFFIGSETDIRVSIGVLVLLAVVKGLFRYLEQYLGHAVAFAFLARLRVRLFQTLSGSEWSALQEKQTGDLVARISDDIDRVEPLYAHTVGPLVSAVAVPLLASVAAGLWIGAGLAWLIGSAAMAYLALVPWLGVTTARRDAEAEREDAGAISGNAAEMIRGMTQLVSFGAVDRMLDRIESLDTARSRALLRGGRTGAFRAGLGGLIAGGLILGAAWSLHAAFSGGDLGVAELASGLVLAWVSLEPLRALDRVVPDAMRAIGAGRRLLGLEDLEVEIRGDLPTPREPLGVEVAAVRYEKGERQILDGVTFDVVPGSSVGLVGASGTGKSTLLDLIAGLRLPSAGSVRVAGVEVHQLDVGSLRSEVQLVSQRADLFHGTIESNLRLAKPHADEGELRRALDTAGLSDWIGEVGLDTEIGELGRSISGGEAQRLSLARALLTDPRILLLDEVTSALDSKTEEHVLDAILGTPGRTTIVVSHRLEIMQNVDRVLVMERGALLEDGPHSALIERGGPYAALWATHRDLLEIG